jgi:hypothetical protein
MCASSVIWGDWPDNFVIGLLPSFLSGQDQIGTARFGWFITNRTMTLFTMNARGHHGYPQPEDDYEKVVYSNHCSRCGVHGNQIAPFRLKRSQRAQHSDFLQLNWVFDVFFVLPEVAAGLEAATVTGYAFGPALDHRTGGDLGNRVQLIIPTIIRCAETSRLPAVTCRPNNEESQFEHFGGGEKRYNVTTPYCGQVKYHPPTSLAVNLEGQYDLPDVFQTAEWFGSGGSAHRETLVSERFVTLVRERNWRGLDFEKVQEIGVSRRHWNLGRS